MKIIVAENYKELSQKAANLISAQVILKSDSVLGLATGSTPIGIYDQLVDRYQKGDLDFSQVSTVNLDEYYGLCSTDEQSYRYYMEKYLFSKVNLSKERCFLPDGTNLDGKIECKRYQDLIDALGGIDLQLLGLGHNGHIGFNEPADFFEKEVHLVNLTEQTIQANQRFFASIEEVPKQAYTMGIGTIFQAKKILLVVNGKEKAEALKKVVQGAICSQVPGSILQLHADVTVVADKEAASLL